jgi:hypothetical protein
MTMADRPAKLGTVYTARARIRYIDELAGIPLWVTAWACADTPNATKAALAEARKYHPGVTLWVHSDTNGKYLPDV